MDPEQLKNTTRNDIIFAPVTWGLADFGGDSGPEAKDFAALRASYDAAELKPEVSYELEAIWRPPSAQGAQKFKGVALA